MMIKFFINSTISTNGAKFATADLSNFYLMTPLKQPGYGRVKLTDIPDEIIEEYKLREKATSDGWVYMKVVRGMYGLPQSGSNSHDELEERLNKQGYFKILLVPALWKHNTRRTQFVLIVDDFGIKYFTKSDLDHLIDILKQHYDVAVDTEAKEIVKIELDWDYMNKKVHFVNETLPRQVTQAIRQRGSQETPTLPVPTCGKTYGAKQQQQFAEYDKSAPAVDEEKKHIQKVTGKFLWYGRGVDGTILI